MNNVYSLQRRLGWAIAALVVGIAIAGFWNYHLVDGFGRQIVAGNTIGDTDQLAHSFDQNGYGFGFIFATIAGLAATLTACNCVVFAMIPGLVCSTKESPMKAALRSLAVFTVTVLLISLVYGFIVGSLGAEGIQALNERPVRLMQAKITFTLLGIAMVLWAAISFGFLNRPLQYIPVSIRHFFNKSSTKAAIMGIFVGLFSVGRPFPVFRNFMTYTADTGNQWYSAATMSIQGLGQIAVMVILMISMTYVFRKKIAQWVVKSPYQPQLVSSIALAVGGSYFIYYWGFMRIWDVGGWGFKLGWY